MNILSVATLVPIAFGAWFAMTSPVRAQTAPVLDARLGEQILMVPFGAYGIMLETTLFKPPGGGPFPLVVINHGKSAGNTVFQPRARYTVAAREFVRRGYAVAIPMRRGFSKSGGAYIGGGCNTASNGEGQAEDVRSALNYFVKQPYVDPTRILVVGQSHGGLTTMAFGAEPYPGVKALVNFAGGIRQDDCSGWQGALARAFGSYGEKARLPSLWFYGANDSYWAPSVYRDMHAAYVKGGGIAQLIEFGMFKGDAHGMFASSDGLPIWLPELEKFLPTVGLPFTPVFEPSLSGISADMADPARVPYLKDAGRTAYRAFLDRAVPRAFAISAGSSWGWASEGADPNARALGNCQKNSAQPCRLYAVDDEIVWREQEQIDPRGRQ